MSTTPRRAGTFLFVLASLASFALPEHSIDASTGGTQRVEPDPTSTRTVLEAGAEARSVAYELLGNRPFQVVLMSGSRAVMTASSQGTSPSSDVPVASISKLVTSMTVMRLVETGRLSLDSTLGDILSASLVPEQWRPVTIAQLLSHTSGFSADRDRWFNDTYRSCLDAFSRTVRRDSRAASGYEYSNTNFCALSLAVGASSGPSYDDAAYRLVLRPLGIDRKTMDPQYAHLAGAGGWRMSALDIARITSALDPAAVASPLTPSTRTSMIQQTTFNYGLGVWIWDPGTYGHSGTLYRSRNIAVRLPSGRVAVILTQATFPDSGLDLLPIAQRIDSAFEASCSQGPCTFVGLDPFNGTPSAVLGRPHI